MFAMLGVAGSVQAQDGWETIFDGKTLDKWDGNPEFWRVEDGTITGQTTEAKVTKGNTFIIWRGGETADFELKLEYKIVNGNSGIQYRSFEVPTSKPATRILVSIMVSDSVAFLLLGVRKRKSELITSQRFWKHLAIRTPFKRRLRKRTGTNTTSVRKDLRLSTASTESSRLS